MGQQGIYLYDCGCVLSRPKESKLFASRWRVSITTNYLILHCKDCGRRHHFELKKPGVQLVKWDRSRLEEDKYNGEDEETTSK